MANETNTHPFQPLRVPGLGTIYAREVMPSDDGVAVKSPGWLYGGRLYSTLDDLVAGVTTPEEDA